MCGGGVWRWEVSEGRDVWRWVMSRGGDVWRCQTVSIGLIL